MNLVLASGSFSSLSRLKGSLFQPLAATASPSRMLVNSWTCRDIFSGSSRNVLRSRKTQPCAHSGAKYASSVQPSAARTGRQRERFLHPLLSRFSQIN